jgi:hypothetical protein
MHIAETQIPSKVRAVLIGIEDLCDRVTTTFDPDTLEQDRGVLKKIVREFEARSL